MDNRLKKILIVSSYAPPSLGGPQMLYNLLVNMPKESYCILTSFYNIDSLSLQKGTWLSGKYVFYDNPKASGYYPENLKQKSKDGNFLSKLKYAAKTNALLRALIGIPITVGQIFVIIWQGVKAIKQNKIEVLVGISDYGPAMVGTYILHKLTGKPFFVYFFDLYKGNYFPFPGGIIANIFEPMLVKSSAGIIVTNQGTKEFYQKRYQEELGKKITVIYNSVFPESYKNVQEKTASEPPHTILFTGRISWPQIGSIQNLISAVSEMDNIKIKFYCPNPREYLEKMGVSAGDKIEVDSAAPHEMPAIQSQADILFLPLSWNTKSPQIINTATPGKLTDYLIAGRPMLIHAPASSHLVKYARENNFAAIVDENNISKLTEMISKVLTDQNFAQAIVENARKTFFANHDAVKNSQAFSDLFTRD